MKSSCSFHSCPLPCRSPPHVIHTGEVGELVSWVNRTEADRLCSPSETRTRLNYQVRTENTGHSRNPADLAASLMHACSGYPNYCKLYVSGGTKCALWGCTSQVCVISGHCLIHGRHSRQLQRTGQSCAVWELTPEAR